MATKKYNYELTADASKYVAEISKSIKALDGWNKKQIDHVRVINEINKIDGTYVANSKRVIVTYKDKSQAIAALNKKTKELEVSTVDATKAQQNEVKHAAEVTKARKREATALSTVQARFKGMIKEMQTSTTASDKVVGSMNRVLKVMAGTGVTASTVFKMLEKGPGLVEPKIQRLAAALDKLRHNMSALNAESNKANVAPAVDPRIGQQNAFIGSISKNAVGNQDDLAKLYQSISGLDTYMTKHKANVQDVEKQYQSFLRDGVRPLVGQEAQLQKIFKQIEDTRARLATVETVDPRVKRNEQASLFSAGMMGLGTQQDKNASTQEVARYAAAVSAVSKEMTKAGQSASRTSLQFQRFMAEGGKPLEGLSSGLQTSFARLRSATEALGASHKKAQEHAEKQKASLDNLAKSTAFYVKLVAVQLAHQAISAMVRSLFEAVAYTKELSLRIAEIQTIDSTDSPFAKWAEGLAKIAATHGFNQVDVAAAAYETLSNQIAEGADALRFLDDAAKLALATVSSLGDATDMLSTMINSFGKSTADAERISAMLFKSVDLGRFKLTDIANTFGRVAVPANLLGLSMQELLGYFSALTNVGVKGSEGMTYLRNAFMKLLEPTDEMKKQFREWGVESGDQLVRAEKLEGVINKLSDAFGMSAAKIAENFSTIRATTAIMMSVGEGGKRIKTYVEEIDKAMKEYNAAVIKVATNSSKTLDRVGQEAMAKITQLMYAVLGLTAKAAKGLVDLISLPTGEGTALSKQLDAYKAFVDSISSAEEKANAEQVSRAQAAVNARRKMVFEAEDAISQKLHDSIEPFDDAYAKYTHRMQEALNDADRVVTAHALNIKDAYSEIRKATMSAYEKMFDLDLESMGYADKIKTVTKEIEKLQKQTLKIKDYTSYKDTYDKIFNMEDRLIEIQKEASTNNERTAKRRIEIEKQIAELKSKYSDQQTDLGTALSRTRTTKGKARLADKSDVQEREYKQRLSALIKEYNSLEYVEKRSLDNRERLAETTKKYNTGLALWANREAIAKRATEATFSSEKLRVKQIERLQEKMDKFNAETAIRNKDVKSIQEQISTVSALNKNTTDKEINSILAERIGLYQKMLEAIQNRATLEQQDANVIKEKEAIEKLRQARLEKQTSNIEKQRDILSTIYKYGGKSADAYYNASSDTERIKAQEEVIKRLQSSLQPKPLTTAGASLGAVSNQQQTVSKEEAAKIKLALAAIKDPVQSKLQNILATQVELQNKALTTQNAMVEGVENYKAQIREINDDLRTMIHNWSQVNAARLGKTTTPAPAAKASGGTIDSILALLRPGEYVVNPMAAKKNYSALQSVNADMVPGFASGGLVNSWRGDININYTGTGNTQNDVIQLGNLLRREIRRGTVRLQ